MIVLLMVIMIEMVMIIGGDDGDDSDGDGDDGFNDGDNDGDIIIMIIGCRVLLGVTLQEFVQTDWIMLSIHHLHLLYFLSTT